MNDNELDSNGRDSPSEPKYEPRNISPLRYLSVLTGESEWTPEEQDAIEQDPVLRQRITRLMLAMYAPLLGPKPTPPDAKPKGPVAWREPKKFKDAPCEDEVVAAGLGAHAGAAAAPKEEFTSASRVWTGKPAWSNRPSDWPEELSVVYEVLDGDLEVTIKGLEDVSTARYQAVLVAVGNPAIPIDSWFRTSKFKARTLQLDQSSRAGAQQLYVFLAERRGKKTELVAQPIPIRL
ncbi:hypothetical protein GobsT_25750 [Gemmata obscuriglobus]|uniref:Uncharacterized protein n=1 Tax=Gemmata obscuriglobus TaxID=114 RepID=A0A2Z3H828_9BACT|nr:hypothetical protein [Gemmata obscuriglobus]AWM39145.1 hypothetical protein C1280_20590 [Gemmata obscuriglobus]QEG27811.1 hypothetical protein GobsT_25750 [Gemmata obscuriglobus]VTS05148.1 unnamed protein product [Gemmata obscuriglobus UQM 2246]